MARDMRVGGAAAASHDVEPDVGDEALELRRERGGRLQIVAILIGQPRVGIAGDAQRRHLADGADVVGHEFRAGGAVEADREQVGMQNRGAEGVRGLPRQHGSHGLDGARDHRRNRLTQFAPQTLDGQQCGFDIARVLAGFDQQDIRPALDQRARLLVKIRDQLREGHAAGDGDGLGGGADGAGDEAWTWEVVENSSAAWRARRAAARFSSWALIREPVFVQHERRAAESVGLDDVCAGREIGRWIFMTASGRVRMRFSLQPSSAGPPKSSAERRACCSMVPMAPSSTRIRVSRISSSACRRSSGWVIGCVL